MRTCLSLIVALLDRKRLTGQRLLNGMAPMIGRSGFQRKPVALAAGNVADQPFK